MNYLQREAKNESAADEEMNLRKETADLEGESYSAVAKLEVYLTEI